MKALLDTNILLDYLLSREGYANSSKLILKFANAGIIDLVVTDLTIANIAYITRKQITLEEFYNAMNTLSRFYTVIPIGPNVIQKALVEQWQDFEDSLQNFAAEQASAEYIITRNVKDYSSSTLKVISPDEFINMIQI